MPVSRNAVLRVASAVLLAAAAVFYVALQFQSPDRAPNVIIISLDTTRADHLGCYNPDRQLTPNLDALAASSTVFVNCVAPVPLTLPSHTAMMTGKIPLANGIHQNGEVVSAANETLAEVLREQGYTTAAFVSQAVLARQHKLDQGFDLYDDMIPDDSEIPGQRRGQTITDLAGGWVAQQGPRGSFFLFAHYFDAHEPYRAPAEWADRFGPSDAEQYAAEIAYQDACVGDLLGRLKSLGLYDSSLIIVVGDHGEMLGDHGERDHGFFLYESAIKVPLIIKLPGQREGRRVEDIAAVADVTPTVCSVLGVDPPGYMQGEDLSAYCRGRGERDDERYVYSESVLPQSFYNAHPFSALVGRRWKYIHGPVPELYDLSSDRAEIDNLYDARPPQARVLRDALRNVFETCQSVEPGGNVDELDPETRDLLVGLGYAGLDRQIAPAFDTGGDDPRALIDLHIAFHHDVRKLRAREEYDQAVELCRTIVAQRPNAPECLNTLAAILAEAGRPEEAVVAYTDCLALDSDQPTVHVKRGQMYLELDQTVDAIKDFEQALSISPDNLRAHSALAEIYIAQGRLDEAETHQLAILARRQDRPVLLVDVAMFYLEHRQEPDKALAYASRAVELAPHGPAQLFALAWALEGTGQTERALAAYYKARSLLPDPGHPLAEKIDEAVERLGHP